VRNLSFNDKRVHCLEKLKPPPGLAVDISKLAVCHTSLTGAINLAWHLGAAKIVLLGADLKGDDHHHPPHPWKVSQNCYPLMLSDLRLMMEELNRRNFPIVNTSMDSACDFIPKVNLGEACAI
jgi:hypothetical protein